MEFNNEEVQMEEMYEMIEDFCRSMIDMVKSEAIDPQEFSMIIMENKLNKLKNYHLDVEPNAQEQEKLSIWKLADSDIDDMINFAEEVVEQVKLCDEEDENYDQEELDDKLNEIVDRLDSYMEHNLQLSK